MKSLIFGCFLFIFVASIIVPLERNKHRCMITYCVDQAETIKLAIKFPIVPQQQKTQPFIISWRNTQNQQTYYDKIKTGLYRKQLELKKNIIYEICFWLNSTRDLRDLKVEYQAENMFQIQHQEVKMPQGLLKSTQLQNTYRNADELLKTANVFAQFQQKRAQTQDQIFNETASANGRLITMSMIQLVVVVLAGMYQFWLLRNYLIQKQWV